MIHSVCYDISNYCATSFGEEEVTFTSTVLFMTSFILTYLILAVIGKYIWNKFLVSLVPSIKPVRSIWQILALVILFNVIF